MLKEKGLAPALLPGRLYKSHAGVCSAGYRVHWVESKQRII